MGQFDQLWAGWRAAYIDSVTSDDPPPLPQGEGSLFERLLAMPDEDAYVLYRGERCSALLNAYPYTNGHLMVLPNRAIVDLDDLDEHEMAELWTVVREAVNALRRVYRCDGVNVGLNLGTAAGAGLPDHVHVHVVPRWHGDTNFMTAAATTRVLPEPLDVSWKKLREAWPG